MNDWIGDIAIVGGGIVGLAAARELLQRRPGSKLIILEKESRIGQHQSGHNSGVIHSGIYYAPGLAQGKACVVGARGADQLLRRTGIPFERCGKVVVATRAAELERLDELYRRGTANGVPGLEMIGPERLREIEPHCVGLRALWAPGTGIIDYDRVVASYAEDVRTLGGEIRTSSEVTGMTTGPRTTLLTTSNGVIETRTVVACAGVYADRVAALTSAPRNPRIVPFRGDYYLIRPDRRYLVKNMIYPVPDPSFPFLGVHFTRRMDGSIWLGPNAVLAFCARGVQDHRRQPARPGRGARFRWLPQAGCQVLADRAGRDGSRREQVGVPEVARRSSFPRWCWTIWCPGHRAFALRRSARMARSLTTSSSTRPGTCSMCGTPRRQPRPLRWRSAR